MKSERSINTLSFETARHQRLPLNSNIEGDPTELIPQMPLIFARSTNNHQHIAQENYRAGAQDA